MATKSKKKTTRPVGKVGKKSTKKGGASTPPAAKLPKVKPPVVTVRAGSQGERVVTVKWPDGAQLELSARTEGDWHLIGSYPDTGLVLDRVEVVPESSP